MGKKCIPGVFCIENMTLFLLFIIVILIIYCYTALLRQQNNTTSDTKYILVAPQNQNAGMTIGGVSSRIILDPNGPPLRNDGVYFPKDSADVRGNIPVRGAIPINMETRSTNMDYTQIGILTRNQGQDPLILPLMGRQPMTGRDKWQYYTISNTGNMNTKLPVSLNGKSCTGEYGCDILNNGDIVYVEGYNNTFRATIYENSLFRYIPYL
jgi:hypothetical protein